MTKNKKAFAMHELVQQLRDAALFLEFKFVRRGKISAPLARLWRMLLNSGQKNNVDR